MNLVYPVCCGIDVHKASVVCCLRRVDDQGEVLLERQTFGTTTSALLALLQWLVDEACPIVVMESTGVYWKPVYNILCGQVQVLLANAQQVKPPTGKKTDKADAQWLSELLAHGLIKPSFVPPPEIQGIRNMTRLRVELVETRTMAKNRVLKVLEDANIKLSDVASNVFGKSGREMLAALLQGKQDPEALANLAKGLLRKKIPELQLALDGRFTEHHAMLVRLSLEQIDLLDNQIAQIEAKLEEKLATMQDEEARLATIPGVKGKAIPAIIGEIGVDMSRFDGAGRLSSWAGLSPGNNESAGKRRRGKTRKGNKYLKRVLVQCAWAASKTDTFLGRSFHRLAARIGSKRAAVAVAHKILVIIYHILDKGTIYEDERYDDLEAKRTEKAKNQAVKWLEKLGYRVQIEPAEKPEIPQATATAEASQATAA